MHSYQNLLAAVVIASTAIAAPLNEITERSAKFSVHQTLNPGFKEFYTTGQAALAKAYAKYGATMPADVSNAVSAAAAASSGTFFRLRCHFATISTATTIGVTENIYGLLIARVNLNCSFQSPLMHWPITDLS